MSVETLEYLSAAKRFIRAAGRRCAEADEIELGRLFELHATVDEALLTAVRGLRERGMSWQYIASATGVTRQAALKRWGARL